MGALQPRLPSPATLPRNWNRLIIDLKDYFFTIPPHAKDAPRFAFSFPKINRSEPMDRYHWTLLPQEMTNSPTIMSDICCRSFAPCVKAIPSCVHLSLSGWYIVLQPIQELSARSAACSTAGVAKKRVTNCARKNPDGGTLEILRLEDNYSRVFNPKM